jgi:long-subunit fatty acid transport protein
MTHNQKFINNSLSIIIIFCFTTMTAQTDDTMNNSNRSEFWSHVRFGGAVGLNIGNNYTEITLAPSAIYDFNRYFSLGVGLRGSYAQEKNYYESWIYGGSLIALSTPLDFLQLSVELEQLRYNVTNEYTSTYQDNFWNTGLYLGAGYFSRNVTVGIRYNVLHDSDKIYSEPWLPFVRVYF